MQSKFCNLVSPSARLSRHLRHSGGQERSSASQRMHSMQPANIHLDGCAGTPLDADPPRPPSKGLIVVASLLDKAPNLAGLARSAEAFGAQALTVADLRLTKTPLFESVSVTAEQWVDVCEVRGSPCCVMQRIWHHAQGCLHCWAGLVVVVDAAAPAIRLICCICTVMLTPCCALLVAALMAAAWVFRQRVWQFSCPHLHAQLNPFGCLA